MIRKIRKRLWLIGYYSATRRRTVWSRWIERALFASVVLAVPAMLAMESLVTRSSTADQVSGRLATTEDGVLLAAIEGNREPEGFGSANPVGDWTLRSVHSERGWPFPSRRGERLTRLDLNRFDQPDLEIDARLAADDPIRAAIDGALARGNGIITSLGGPAGRTTQTQRDWRGTVAGTLAWWVSLSVVSVAVIRLLALRSHFRRARRLEASAVRASAGRCPACDYDLRGLEFSPRCPECGKLM